MTTKRCTKCKRTQDISEFGISRHDTPKSTCKTCIAVKQRESRETAETSRKPKYVIDPLLIKWVRKHARRPNHRGHLQTIKAWNCAGMDEGIVVLGDAVERVVNPLLGHPMLLVRVGDRDDEQAQTGEA